MKIRIKSLKIEKTRRLYYGANNTYDTPLIFKCLITVDGKDSFIAHNDGDESFTYDVIDEKSAVKAFQKMLNINSNSIKNEFDPHFYTNDIVDHYISILIEKIKNPDHNRLPSYNKLSKVLR